ncbi:MAG: phosphate acetyltransferase [Candidatus Azobacteroides pseudotrichonymphae]|jgi:phosphate acetyltransferase|uniref:Phosphate acetyltransferase n=1 Tax=Azobacteroides pseudotrichonymphae genomovar. CFP2 TaxID=511995 RepID=B6YQ99_AZOPC|nr:phosphate acetyltransferase [Candidatus Azobacteroides pseudotrichonymphae]MDR0530166.1 phosphate acetyltransferase [Bacteroidales bacterium OttesenSCG-928-I14]BAG83371.1 phosphate acetyltransferase [Candidatus Azobacteroides pseudotrichonymphae genomovar. CFP2]GMO36728.1 MAG: phosphate acetyltransferase [Candidatus Azobacteroides pseudotrichonymphae]
MNLMHQIITKARNRRQRIVLSEGTEERTLRAADRAIADKIADIILLGNIAEIKALTIKYGLRNVLQAVIVDPIKNERKNAYAVLLMELRKNRGMTIVEAQKLVENPLYLGCLMIKNGDADGEIAGAQNTTSDVLRPALQIIKTTPGINVVSGAFLMLSQNEEYGANGVLIFADCAVVPNPNAKELAEIAVSTAITAKTLIGIEPIVALLSFSTKGSASHELVDKINEAVCIAKSISPELIIDGELQADAALVPFIGQSKAPGSLVAGKANVLVFPNLECGNIAYKLVQRLGNIQAIGPILQGIAAPVNDLSRGCSVEDIYTMIAICANQAIMK